MKVFFGKIEWKKNASFRGKLNDCYKSALFSVGFIDQFCIKSWIVKFIDHERNGHTNRRRLHHRIKETFYLYLFISNITCHTPIFYSSGHGLSNLCWMKHGNIEFVLHQLSLPMPMWSSDRRTYPDIMFNVCKELFAKFTNVENELCALQSTIISLVCVESCIKGISCSCMHFLFRCPAHINFPFQS